MKTIRAVVPGAVGVLLFVSAAAQGPIASDQPASVTRPAMEATMMRVVPFFQNIGPRAKSAMSTALLAD
jgi:hypothetical protein